jgi:hypothetical protein
MLGWLMNWKGSRRKRRYFIRSIIQGCSWRDSVRPWKNSMRTAGFPAGNRTEHRPRMLLLDKPIPCILNLDTRGKYAVSLKLQPLHPRTNSSLYPLHTELNRSQSQAEHRRRDKSFVPAVNRTSILRFITQRLLIKQTKLPRRRPARLNFDLTLYSDHQA